MIHIHPSWRKDRKYKDTFSGDMDLVISNSCQRHMWMWVSCKISCFCPLQSTWDLITDWKDFNTINCWAGTQSNSSDSFIYVAADLHLECSLRWPVFTSLIMQNKIIPVQNGKSSCDQEGEFYQIILLEYDADVLQQKWDQRKKQL